MGDDRRHGWNTYENYRHVHVANMGKFAHFVVLEELSWDPTPGRVYIRGSVLCLGDLELHVEKELETDFLGSRTKVKTYRYSYHVLRRHNGNVDNLFRFDNFHKHPGHPDGHHFHVMSGEDETGAVIHTGAIAWPTMGEVLERMEEIWIHGVAKDRAVYAGVRRQLPSP